MPSLTLPSVKSLDQRSLTTKKTVPPMWITFAWNEARANGKELKSAAEATQKQCLTPYRADYSLFRRRKTTGFNSCSGFLCHQPGPSCPNYPGTQYAGLKYFNSTIPVNRTWGTRPAPKDGSPLSMQADPRTCLDPFSRMAVVRRPAPRERRRRRLHVRVAPAEGAE